jgi:hypothetical protein
VADQEGSKTEFGIDLVGMEEVRMADCLIFLVAHKQFNKSCGWQNLMPYIIRKAPANKNW